MRVVIIIRMLHAWSSIKTAKAEKTHILLDISNEEKHTPVTEAVLQSAHDS